MTGRPELTSVSSGAIVPYEQRVWDSPREAEDTLTRALRNMAEGRPPSPVPMGPPPPLMLGARVPPLDLTTIAPWAEFREVEPPQGFDEVHSNPPNEGESEIALSASVEAQLRHEISELRQQQAQWQRERQEMQGLWNSQLRIVQQNLIRQWDEYVASAEERFGNHKSEVAEALKGVQD